VAAQPLGRPVVPIGSVLAMDPTGRLLAVNSTAPAQVVSQRDWSPVWTVPGRGETYSAAFSPNGSLLALGDRTGVLKVWDVRAKRQVSPLLGDRGPDSVWSVAFSPDGRYLAAIGRLEWLRVWRVGSWKLVAVRSDAQDDALPGFDVVMFTPENDLLTVGGDIAVWPLEGDRLGRPVRIADVLSDYAALAPNGRTLALGTDQDSQVRLFDLRTKRLDEPLSGHTDGVDSLAFSPDGRILATASAFDDTIRLWDVASGRALGNALRSDVGSPLAVAFTADNRFVSAHGAVVEWDPILWRGTLEQFRERLCPAAGRNLRPEEWARFLPGRPYAKTCPGE
jgi:WD40 repeat protein